MITQGWNLTNARLSCVLLQETTSFIPNHVTGIEGSSENKIRWGGAVFHFQKIFRIRAGIPKWKGCSSFACTILPFSELEEAGAWRVAAQIQGAWTRARKMSPSDPAGLTGNLVLFLATSSRQVRESCTLLCPICLAWHWGQATSVAMGYKYDPCFSSSVPGSRRLSGISGSSSCESPEKLAPATKSINHAVEILHHLR